MKYLKYAASVDCLSDQAVTRVFGIKTNTYSSSIPLIMNMVEIAKHDFPGLTDEDIHVVAYDGDRWKRQMGIEFSININHPVPEDYKTVILEYVFAGN